MQHSVWNMYSIIQNGMKSHRRSVNCPKTMVGLQILKVLYREGHIGGFCNVSKGSGFLKIFLKYDRGIPVIKRIFSISKPGRRVYLPLRSLWKIDTSLMTLVVSTPMGILSDKECRKYSQGGEVLCVVV